MARLLLVDPDPAALERLAEPLVELGHVVFAAVSRAEAERVFRTESLDVALVALRLGEESGLALLEGFKQWDPRVQVILLTDGDGVRTVVRAMKLGAFDVVPRSLPGPSVVGAVTSALRARSLEGEVEELRRQLGALTPSPLTDPSPAMREVLRLARMAAKSDVTVLLTGESGVGKEVIARAIVAGGSRSARPLVTIDCGALPATIIESELFGHERGAFTGAVSRKPGRLEAADGGTLLLDEVGTLPLALQGHLLRVLETGEVVRLGGTSPVRLDVRFLAATNSDLETLVREGKLRQDLFHRFNVFPIHVPPLRERKASIASFADDFRLEFSRKHRKSVAPLEPATVRLLEDYPWPGNVRELRNVIERAVILAEERIEPEHLGGIARPVAAAAGAGGGADDDEVLPLRAAKERASSEAARRQIERALRRTGGDKRAAARLLGVSLKTLYNHLGTP